MDETGHTTIEWTKQNEADWQHAKDEFAKAKVNRIAYKRDPESGSLEQIHDFDVDAKEITMGLPLVGG